MEAPALRIGTVARRAGVAVDTLRYYERRGLVCPAGRSASRYRLYGPDAVARVRFIRRARALGFPLDQIAALLALSAGDDPPCDEARRQAELRLEDVEQRIRGLERIRGALRGLLEACSRRSGEEACPVLSVLAGEGTDSEALGTDEIPSRSSLEGRR